MGIIPAGSDNSLVWTVLGVRDPISAALAIVKVSLSFPYDIISKHNSYCHEIYLCTDWWH